MSIEPVRRRGPIWLATPSRWSKMGRARGRAVLMALILLVALALALPRDLGVETLDGSPGMGLVEAVRHGADYYAALAATVQDSMPAASGWTTPLPTLVLIEAHIPSWCASAAMMLVAVAVVVGWYARFGGLLTTRAARSAGLLLMLAGVAVALRLPLVAAPEGWAGLLVALSLARRAPGRVTEAAALGLAAAALSCAALPYAAVMAAVAAWERAWREWLAWLMVLAVGVMLVLLQGQALALASPIGADAATGMLAPGAALAAMASTTGFRLLPVAIAASLVVLATIGWASRHEQVAVRVTAILVLQAVIVAILRLPAAALVVAPLLPLGLVALPDAIRDLAAAALDRRRITVTRIARGGLSR